MMKNLQRFDRLLPLLALLFIIDVIAVFKGYWWKDTYRSVYWSLALITIINVIFPKRHPLIRIPTDLLISILITFRVTWHRQPEIVEHFSERFPFVHPFMEITMGTVLVLMLLERFVTNKRRLIMVFALGLLILSIRDSFSPLRLWLHIALLVVLFLIWHTLLHYRSMDSGTLAKLLKRPFALFSPVVAVLLCITVIGFSLPHGPPLLEDPYALWKKSRGESIPAFIGDKGYVSGAGTQLLTISGYSRDSSQLGGGFNYDYSPVMTVDTTQKGYLRGETKSIYDGKGWIDSPELAMPEAVRVGRDISSSNEAQAQYTKVHQTISIFEKRTFPVLFVNGMVQQIESLVQDISGSQGEEPRLLAVESGFPLKDYNWDRHSDAVIAPEGVEPIPVFNYSASSKALVIDTDGLKLSKSSIDAFADQDASNQSYVDVASVVPARVYELAQSVTAAGKNDYERALLLEQHLRMNYVYTNLPDSSRLTGSSTDFVDQFLFELQEGYCDYFSTAMVIMARTLGMPARWVKGYTAGVSEQEQMMNSTMYMQEQMEPVNSGKFTVRNADAHSWVEIYFAGYGWVPFEPTPGFSIPQQYGTQQVEDILQDLLPSSQPSAVPDISETKKESALTAGQKRLIVWGSSLLLIALIIALAIYHRRALAVKWRNLRYLSYTNNEKIVEETNALLRKGKRKGLPVHHNWTMRETLQQWKTYYSAVTNELDELLYLFELASYSGTTMSEQQVEQVRKIVDHVKKQWKN